jgi:hypothetical protein
MRTTERLGRLEAVRGAARLSLDDGSDLALHAVEAIAGGEPVESARVAAFGARGGGLAQLRHPHHEHLVEIARHDAEKAQALPERRRPDPLRSRAPGAERRAGSARD